MMMIKLYLRMMPQIWTTCEMRWEAQMAGEAPVTKCKEFTLMWRWQGTLENKIVEF